MAGSDIWLGFTKAGTVQVWDMWAAGHSRPVPDATQSLTAISGGRRDGILTWEVDRAVSTGLGRDRDIKPGEQWLLYAESDSNPATIAGIAHHDRKGSRRINLLVQGQAVIEETKDVDSVSCTPEPTSACCRQEGGACCLKEAGDGPAVCVRTLLPHIILVCHPALMLTPLYLFFTLTLTYSHPTLTLTPTHSHSHSHSHSLCSSFLLILTPYRAAPSPRVARCVVSTRRRHAACTTTRASTTANARRMVSAAGTSTEPASSRSATRA